MTGAAALHAATAEPMLAVSGLAKRYGETRALICCDLAIHSGRIHAVIGENGSGKSTLVKILTGVVLPDSGRITMAGTGVVRLASPRDARAAGIATTFQEILALEELSLLDNLWLGQEGLFRRRVPEAAKADKARAVLSELLGDAVPPLDSRMGDLDLGTRQAAVIARSLLLQPRLLILDEATAAIDVAVRDRLFAALRQRLAQGMSVLFITHKMDEIAALADDVTVLRSGESVAHLPVAEATPARMLHLMSGRRAEPAAHLVAVGGAVRLRLRHAELRTGARPFSLDVREGEVLGLAGLEGHGADLAAQVLGGSTRAPSGHVETAAGQVPKDLGDFVRAGIAYVPRDRKREGIFAPLSIAENFAMASMNRHAMLGIIDTQRIETVRAPLFDRLAVKHGSPQDAITSLSGGNQQKVILARMLALGPSVLVLNDPTRGVDLATKQDIYALLAEQAAAGVTVVVHSTEIDELLSLCTRVAVFHHDTMHSILSGPALTRYTLVSALFGQAP